MSSEIKLYLVIRNSDDSLKISEHVNVGELHLEWTQTFEMQPEATGLVHAAMVCPDESEAIGILKKIRGRILVSESARWFLPPEYDETSHAVAHLAETAQQREMPIYLALSGWGYDFSVDADSAPQSYDNEAEKEQYASSWFDALTSENPSLAAELELYGISSSESYRQNRDLVSPESRIKIETFRFKKLFSAIDDEDPFQIIRIAPTWLLRVPVIELGLTVRCSNVLDDRNIKVVSELLAYRLDEAMRWRNFGKKSVRDLAGALLRAIEYGADRFALAAAIESAPNGDDWREYDDPRSFDTSHLEQLLAVTAESSLKDSLQAAQAALSERERVVFDERLIGNPRRTLEELGTQFGVTRERVRQIETRCLRIISEQHLFPRLLVYKLEKLLAGRATPLNLLTVHEEDEWFAGFENNLESLASVIRSFSEDRFFVLGVGGRLVVATIDEEVLESLKRDALNRLRAAEPLSRSQSDVEAMLGEMMIIAGAPELSRTLFDEIADQLHFTFSRGEGEPRLSGIGWGVNHTVIALLNEAEQPLHFSEFTRRCSARLNREVEERRVHSVLITHRAKYFWRGTYGTIVHFPFPPDVQDEIRTELENVVLSGNVGRQWHAKELADMLLEIRSDLPEGIDKYLVNIVLEDSTSLKSLGRLVWISADDGQGAGARTTSDRLELMELCVEILQEAGRPMQSEEIRAEISKRRGIGEHFFIQPTNELARVKPNVWGLVERDFLTTADERQELLNALFSILSARDVGLYDSELTTALQAGGYAVPHALTDYMLMSLAHSDERFNVHRGGIVALAQWGDARRTSVRQAVEQFVANMNCPYALPDILSSIEELVGRRVEKMEIYGLLRQYEVVYHPPTATYRKAVSSEDVADEDPLEAMYRVLGLSD